jgi:serine/threonine-protein kinase 11
MLRCKARALKFEPMLINDHEPKPQTKLNQYILAGRLGRGATSNVHFAIDSKSGQYVAAKVVHLNVSTSATLQSEIRNMRQLSHPNIIQLLEVLHRKDTNTAYLILEHARGSLKGQRFTEPQAVSIYSQVVDGLLYLHRQGLVHQDIKPSNLLLFENGLVKIADFGAVHSFASAEASIGTPAYQAPEFLSDEGSADPAKEDVWSLGVTIFENLFGCLPFKGESVYEIVAKAREDTLDVPASASLQLKDLLTKMLCPDPAERIAMADVAVHPFFAGERQPVMELATAPPKMKVSTSLVSVSAEVCDDNYWFALSPISSSWPGRSALRQFQNHVTC